MMNYDGRRLTSIREMNRLNLGSSEKISLMVFEEDYVFGCKIIKGQNCLGQNYY